MSHLNPSFSQATANQKQRTSLLRRYHSITLPTLGYQEGLIPEDALENRIRAFGAMDIVCGRTVLDLGTASGWNAFWAERNGAAEVRALDYVLYHDFIENHKALSSGVRYLVGDIHHPDVLNIGTHDVVLCFGVVYHCRHPLLALEHVAALTGCTALIESFVIDESHPGESSNEIARHMEFYETTELGGQLDNWYGPTVSCLLALIRSAGFAKADQVYLSGRRVGILARKNPLTAPGDHPATIELTGIVSNLTHSRFFEAQREEYVEAYFVGNQLEQEVLYLQFPSFALAALVQRSNEQGEGQAVFRLPSWLLPGKHFIFLRTESGQHSNSLEIDVRRSGGVSEIDLDHATLKPVRALSAMQYKSTLIVDAVRVEKCEVHTRPPELVVSIFVEKTNWLPAEYFVTVDGCWGIPSTQLSTKSDGRAQLQFRVPAEFLGFQLTLIAPSLGRQAESFLLRL